MIKFAIATPNLAAMMREQTDPAYRGFGSTALVKKDWIYWSDEDSRYELTDSGYVALRLAELAPKLTRQGAAYIKWFDALDGYGDCDGRYLNNVEGALRRAGLLDDYYFLTETGREVRRILRQYDVAI